MYGFGIEHFEPQIANDASRIEFKCVLNPLERSSQLIDSLLLCQRSSICRLNLIIGGNYGIVYNNCALSLRLNDLAINFVLHFGLVELCALDCQISILCLGQGRVEITRVLYVEQLEIRY